MRRSPLFNGLVLFFCEMSMESLRFAVVALLVRSVSPQWSVSGSSWGILSQCVFAAGHAVLDACCHHSSRVGKGTTTVCCLRAGHLRVEESEVSIAENT